jgi:hypothetical protein
MEGARLGHPGCCARLEYCYYEGEGTEIYPTKCFKWAKVAAEKSDVDSMWQCAWCYMNGEGVDQSTEQATHGYEKYLEFVDGEGARNNLQILVHDRSTGVVRQQLTARRSSIVNG